MQTMDNQCGHATDKCVLYRNKENKIFVHHDLDINTVDNVNFLRKGVVHSIFGLSLRYIGIFKVCMIYLKSIYATLRKFAITCHVKGGSQEMLQ